MPTQTPPASETSVPSNARQIHRVEANPRLQVLQHRVASAALCGVACEKIEKMVIEPSDLSEEEKSALRLYSTSFSGRPVDRFEVRRRALEGLRRLSLGETAPTEAPAEQWTA